MNEVNCLHEPKVKISFNEYLSGNQKLKEYYMQVDPTTLHLLNEDISKLTTSCLPLSESTVELIKTLAKEKCIKAQKTGQTCGATRTCNISNKCLLGVAVGEIDISISM